MFYSVVKLFHFYPFQLSRFPASGISANGSTKSGAYLFAPCFFGSINSAYASFPKSTSISFLKRSQSWLGHFGIPTSIHMRVMRKLYPQPAQPHLTRRVPCFWILFVCAAGSVFSSMFLLFFKRFSISRYSGLSGKTRVNAFSIAVIFSTSANCSHAVCLRMRLTDSFMAVSVYSGARENTRYRVVQKHAVRFCGFVLSR